MRSGDVIDRETVRRNGIPPAVTVVEDVDGDRWRRLSPGRDGWDMSCWSATATPGGGFSGEWVYRLYGPLTVVEVAAQVETEEMALMDFSKALEHDKGGRRIARACWSRLDMWVVLQEGYPDGVVINANTQRSTGLPEGTVCRFRPYLMIHVGNLEFAPWTATQKDILADDWMLAR